MKPSTSYPITTELYRNRTHQPPQLLKNTVTLSVFKPTPTLSVNDGRTSTLARLQEKRVDDYLDNNVF